MLTVYKIPSGTTSHVHAINTFRADVEKSLLLMAEAQSRDRSAGTKHRSFSSGRQQGLIAAAEFVRNLIVEAHDA